MSICLLHLHLFLDCKDCWWTTDDFTTSFLHCCLHCPLGRGELQACPFPDVVFPPLPLPVLSSSPFHCASQDGFGQTWWTGDMTIPLQFSLQWSGRLCVVWLLVRCEYLKCHSEVQFCLFIPLALSKLILPFRFPPNYKLVLNIHQACTPVTLLLWVSKPSLSE